LRQLLTLEKDVIALSANLGLGMFFPTVSPEQLYGIEINEYAHELAQATIWIGYIQWLRENGFGQPSEPILKALDNIHEMDAILAFDEAGNPVQPEWPEADVVIGNPPFLGYSHLRAELGDEYVERLFTLYKNRVSGAADLCCYWFEKARAMIRVGALKRAGLLATQGIRGGASREVLNRIKESGNIFWAQSDRDWVLDGAAVHVSMVGFDDGAEDERDLDGHIVGRINAALTSSVDVAQASALAENANLSFIGDMKKGKFELTSEEAQAMLQMPPNPNGHGNSQVLRRWINGADITRRSRNMWIVDFGVYMDVHEAACYEAPFELVHERVHPHREGVRNPRERSLWWIHGRPAAEMREALQPLDRFIATTRVSKHRLFVFVDSDVIVDSAVVAIAREDDYFFGILHSKIHELWARRQGTQLREAESGFRYTPTTCFETFPFPWPPGDEPVDDTCDQAIAAAAKDLVEKRDRWLNPEGADEPELKKRTLTNLYNQRPTWLDLAHQTLDNAVLDAYTWHHDITDEEILERLLALNLERAAKERHMP